jgi:AcrR family transcriptional regulator
MTVPKPVSIDRPPSDDDGDLWSSLDQAAKRERLLSAAGELFARAGLDATMPAVAAAAGAGVGSVYRQFPSKEDLLAALVAQRLETAIVEIEQVIAEGSEPWEALGRLLWTFAERQGSDDVAAEAMAAVFEHPEVAERHARADEALEVVLSAARADGSLRSDARPRDIRLLLSSTRAARRIEADGWKRILQLGLDGLRVSSAGRPQSP